MSKKVIPTKKKLDMYEAQDGLCWWCGEELDLSITSPKDPGMPNFEHIIPKSKGGGKGNDNLRLVHQECNQKRGCNENWVPWFDRDLVEAVKRNTYGELNIHDYWQINRV